jgi:hypothetical protein
MFRGQINPPEADTRVAFPPLGAKVIIRIDSSLLAAMSFI